MIEIYPLVISPCPSGDQRICAVAPAPAVAAANPQGKTVIGFCPPCGEGLWGPVPAGI